MAQIQMIGEIGFMIQTQKMEFRGSLRSDLGNIIDLSNVNIFVKDNKNAKFLNLSGQHLID